ncbi:MAG TPA: c-type cytochrome [Chitinophagaceae bacterium]|nr:c-type cytochrome [Chitinophagaceae bacterium]
MKFNLKKDWPLFLIVLGVVVAIANESVEALNKPRLPENKESPPDHWVAPSLFLDNELEGAAREQVIYGEDIVANTSRYFGPNGSVLQITNGMNCQNCHLQSGTKAWGNNYGSVFSTYPKFRDRSGSIETIPKRVNDCFERSLNGKAIDTSSKEMLAIVAYIKWIGQDVKKGEKPKGFGITELTYMSRAADPKKGAFVYTAKCQTCHGANGEGVTDGNNIGYAYPPLWGEHSYNTGAGLFRLSRFAGYVKDNMPFNQVTHSEPALTDEEAWDVAAFVNTQPRPKKDLSKDWPDISKKPIDHPFGPYADGFSEQQHRYGPFQPIADARKKQKEEKEKQTLTKK